MLLWTQSALVGIQEKPNSRTPKGQKLLWPCSFFLFFPLTFVHLCLFFSISALHCTFPLSLHFCPYFTSLSLSCLPSLLLFLLLSLCPVSLLFSLLCTLVSLLITTRSVSSVVSNSLLPHGLQHARFPCPSPTPKACSNSCPWNRWCYPTITYSVIPFSSCLQSFPIAGSFPMSQFIAWGGQSIRASASTSILSMNIPDWFPLGLTGFISLQSKGLSKVFSNTTVQRHQFFSAQLSL